MMIEDFTEAIQSIPKRVSGSGNRAWTEAVKSVFIELGRRLEWKVCASSSEAGVEPEWLYDLCWYKRGANWIGLDVGLVLESEWSQDSGDLMYDFEKLLCAKSPFKVFIFESHEDRLKEKIDLLQTAIKSCQLTSIGEKYILAAYVSNRQEFDVTVV